MKDIESKICRKGHKVEGNNVSFYKKQNKYEVKTYVRCKLCTVESQRVRDKKMNTIKSRIIMCSQQKWLESDVDYEIRTSRIIRQLAELLDSIKSNTSDLQVAYEIETVVKKLEGRE